MGHVSEASVAHPYQNIWEIIPPHDPPPTHTTPPPGANANAILFPLKKATFKVYITVFPVESESKMKWQLLEHSLYNARRLELFTCIAKKSGGNFSRVINFVLWSELDCCY